jgi:hypothetical protein
LTQAVQPLFQERCAESVQRQLLSQMWWCPLGSLYR